ncbi:TSUP family transporter [Chitinibacter sp. ZOR0017]|uniref:sulfite exporter TauE/SafE family protein n=1 Tax=Chitinibacter sp. ZOR0017 TaxID=1339254 RepID=UPI000648A06C|nr:TSUP family transporter [Chitinibacter sp. ZOR0017]
MSLSLTLASQLIPLSFMAGLIDAAIGGGGLILLPALFTALPKELPLHLLGTNKMTAIWGTLLATRQYLRQVKVPLQRTLLLASTAALGSLLGAHSIGLFPAALLRPVVAVLLLAILLYTLRKPELGQRDQTLATPRPMAAGLLFGIGIGFYDGFFGPGTGAFLLFWLVRYEGQQFLRAAAMAKVVNLSTNAAALLIFVPQQAVLWGLAFPLAVANLLGSWVGTRLVLRFGNRLIRHLFIALASGLLIRLAWQIFADWR